MVVTDGRLSEKTIDLGLINLQKLELEALVIVLNRQKVRGMLRRWTEEWQ